jgi:fructose-1,6-bisphosphatase II / sedoheptulose-1,7-bisphosphatase
VDGRATKTEQGVMDRVLTLELVRVTERAAVAAAMMRGRGDERLADQGAVQAMHAELVKLPVSGRIVIGEGESDEAPLLYTGEEIGNGGGPDVDIALDPLDGKTICAKNLPNSLAVVAIAHRGGFLTVPDVYMDKIAIGPGFPDALVDLEMPADEAIRRLADAKGVKPRDISACVLDRPRHSKLIEAVRGTGASIRLIGDGDVAGIIHTTDPEATGIDIYLGSGGAPEGVLAAAALRCLGGQMCGRLVIDNDEKRSRAEKLGLPRGRVYRAEEMAAGDVLFAATGVTDGNMLEGVRFKQGTAVTHTIVARSSSGTQRWIHARHRMGEKFAPAD